MKRKIYITVISVLFALNTFSQITIKETAVVKSDSTQGFFVKGGTLKLDKLECYNFGDLIVAFNIDKSFFDFDVIEITLTWGSKSDNEYNQMVRLKRAEFAKLVTPKDKYVYFNIFTTTDLKEVSKVFPYCKRTYMQYAGSKNLANDSRLAASVKGYNLTGTETVYETQSDGKVIAREKEVWTEAEVLVSFNIPMLNRIKLSGSAYMFGKYPEEPQVTGDCYN